MTEFLIPILAEAERMSVLNCKDYILEKGGIIMIPLAILSVIASFLIILYLLTLRRGNVVSDKFMGTAESLIRQKDMVGLLSFCDRHDQAISSVTEKTAEFITRNQSATIEEVREVAQAEGTRQAGILNQKITYLADIGAVAPMIGLLGTVIGMIKTFFDLAEGHQESVQQLKLAAGVSEALITTAGGLVIGITCLVFYSIFRGRVQKQIADLEAAATHLLALISAQFPAPAVQVRENPRPPLMEEQPLPARRDIHGL